MNDHTTPRGRLAAFGNRNFRPLSSRLELDTCNGHLGPVDRIVEPLLRILRPHRVLAKPVDARRGVDLCELAD